MKSQLALNKSYKKGLFAFNQKTARPIEEQEEYLKALHTVQKELKIAHQNFEYATEPELIDSCIYELKALQLKYEYYLKQAKNDQE